MERRVSEYGILSPAASSGSTKLLVVLVDENRVPFCMISYYADGDALPDSSLNANNEVQMYKHLSQAAIDIDMLRNEGPVYLVYRSPREAWIQTGAEPIGEGDRSP